MYPDQRADMLRFIGKYVVITVDGIDLDFSYVAGATSVSCVSDAGPVDIVPADRE